MHEIDVAAHENGVEGALVVECSCGAEILPASEFIRSLTLDELTAIAHEHIEAAEAEVINRDAVNDARLGRVGNPEYRTSSALTSEDELIDIETGAARSAPRTT